MSEDKINLYAQFISKQLNESSDTNNAILEDNSDILEDMMREFMEEMDSAANTKITLGGKKHPMNKIPIEHQAEFKKKYPGVRTRFRGKRETVSQLQARSGGEKGKENFVHRTFGDRSGVSVSDTLKKDATHFYVHPHHIKSAGFEVK